MSDSGGNQADMEAELTDKTLQEMTDQANIEMRRRGIKANEETLDFLERHQKDAEVRTRTQINTLHRTAKNTFRDLRVMVWITFTFGIVLIVIAILLFVFQQRTFEALGLGTLGAADWVALYLYKPMDRLQKADADFAQQVMILRSWVICVNLEMLAMDITKPETIIKAAENVQTRSVVLVRAVEKFVEG